MTVDAARRRTRRTKADAPSSASAPESISIGEIEPTVFSCPNCQRPLAIGARRCPRCKTHLVMGVQLSRASAFVAVGLILGLALGGGAAGIALISNGLSRDAEIAAQVKAALAAAQAHPQPVATAAPVESPRPVVTAPPAGGAAIPALARSALVQAASIDRDLAAAVPALEAALRARDFDTLAVLAVLQSVSADAVAGRQLAGHIGGWSDGRELATSLTTYYASLQAAAAEGLAASIRNEAAYKAAATEMVGLLGQLGAVDAQLRAVAGEAGVTLPASAGEAPAP
jgi:hypothetical protein